jgi:hypothetical protein
VGVRVVHTTVEGLVEHLKVVILMCLVRTTSCHQGGEEPVGTTVRVVRGLVVKIQTVLIGTPLPLEQTVVVVVVEYGM